MIREIQGEGVRCNITLNFHTDITYYILVGMAGPGGRGLLADPGNEVH